MRIVEMIDRMYEVAPMYGSAKATALRATMTAPLMIRVRFMLFSQRGRTVEAPARWPSARRS